MIRNLIYQKKIDKYPTGVYIQDALRNQVLTGTEKITFIQIDLATVNMIGKGEEYDKDDIKN